MLARLLGARRFAPLFWCQFLSAFNDNFVKNVLVILILFKIGGKDAGAYVTLAGGVFILPFFILSGIGGELADRYDKALVARRLKLAEIPVAALAATGFLMHSVPLLFAAVFGFGVIAALFGPIKYGILPDHLKLRELPAGNALVEGATFLAILTGTIAGGLAAKGDDPVPVALMMLIFAAVCWISSLFIPPTGEAAPDLALTPHIGRSTAALIRGLRADPRLLRGALAVSWFWVAGSVTLALTPTLVKETLGGTEDVVVLFLAVFSIAIAVGSFIASWIASGRLILWPTPLAALLMGLFAIDLGLASLSFDSPDRPLRVADFLAHPSAWRILLDLAGLLMGAGLYVVPIFAAVQAWSGADCRARVVAGVNVLNALFMVLGALITAAFQSAGLSVPALFILLGGLSIAAGSLIVLGFPGMLSATGGSDTLVPSADEEADGRTGEKA